MTRLPNASEWLRNVIDDARVREPATSTGNRVILLTQQIKDLERQVGSLEQNPTFLEAKQEFSVIHRENEKVESDIKLYEAWLRGENPKGTVSSFDRFMPRDALESKVSQFKEWLTKGLEAEAKPKAIIAGFDQEIQTLEAKRRRLEEELLQEGLRMKTGECKMEANSATVGP